ncbi:hypothetical protein ACO0LF_19105 [Undibacterium sp. Di27W]
MDANDDISIRDLDDNQNLRLMASIQAQRGKFTRISADLGIFFNILRVYE